MAESNHDKDMSKERDQVFCLYPVDSSRSESTTLHLQHSPFSWVSTSTKNVSSIIRHDKENNIYYFPIGIKPHNWFINTSRWKWPKKYTILMWIRWKDDGFTITTFDSESYAPIYSYGKRLGCYKAGGCYIPNYKINVKEWQCVIMYGGDKCSQFYVGDLLAKPKLIGSANNDISRHETYQIGNSSQGPGDVGCIIVYDYHKSMDEMMDLYDESILLMGNGWTKKEIKMIDEILMNYLKIGGITKMVFEFILGRLINSMF